MTGIRTLRYRVELTQDHETGLFEASVPALGISTYGDTRQEALGAVREAILVTVEGLETSGQPVPEGESLDSEIIEVTL